MGCALPACSQGLAHDDPQPEPPPVVPRWIAVLDTESISALRFDDVTKPELLRLSSSENVKLLSWSPDGSHLAYVSADGVAVTLHVASASDDFEVRDVVLPEPPGAVGAPEWSVVAASKSVWADGHEWLRGLSWMGPNTVLLSSCRAERFELYRMPADRLEPERIGEYRAGSPELGDPCEQVVFSATRFGVLYTTGSTDAPELWIARESEEPRRMGAGLLASGGEGYAAAELLWSADGESAAWWTVGKLPEVPFAGGISPPEPSEPSVDVLPEETPSIGHVHVPLGCEVERDPHGDLYFCDQPSYRAQAPGGPGYAFLVNQGTSGSHPRLRASISGRNEVLLGPAVAGFAFVGEARLVFARPADDEPAPGGDAVELTLYDGQARVIDRTPGKVFSVDALPGSDRVYFVREEEGDPRFTLWTAALDVVPERVEIDGSVILDSLLKQGAIAPHVPNYGVGPRESRPASTRGGRFLLLDAASDGSCISRSDHCQTSRWIVDLERYGRAIQLHDRWTPQDSLTPMTWTPDGAGLLASDAEGIHFIPGPDFEGSFGLAGPAEMWFIPESWPAPP
jgi:hypothetical protein